MAVLFDETLVNRDDREELLGDMREIGVRAMDMPEELVDIQALNDSPLSFQVQVISTGSLLYSRDNRDKELYESQVLSEYLDYLYYEDIHHRALQERIGEGKFGYRPKIIVSSSL
jgi:predicted nucleotidyltransferase